MKKKENWKQNRWIIRGAAVFAALALTGCTGGTVTAGGVEMDSAGLQQMDLPSAEGKKIRMSSGDVEVTITLNDSRAAAELAAILPLRLHLIERNGFAKGMTLPVTLSSEEERTRSYKIGDFG